MRRPLIGITTYHREEGDRPRFSLPSAYVEAVRVGGGIPVLLPPGDTPAEQEKAMRYLDKYYDKALDLDVYWGTAREFCKELKRRWEDYLKNG